MNTQTKKKKRKTVRERVTDNVAERVQGTKLIGKGISQQVKSIPKAIAAVDHAAQVPGNILKLQPVSMFKNLYGLGYQTGKALKDFVPGAINIGKGVIKTAFNHEEWYGGDTIVSSGPSAALVNNSYVLHGVMVLLNMSSFGGMSQLEADVVTKLADFNKAMGYDTMLTLSEIIEAIQINAKLASVFTTLYRIDSSRDQILFGTQNLKFGDRLGYIQKYQHVIDDNLAINNFSYVPPSNKVWNDLVIVPSTKLLLSDNMAEFIDYHFANYFTNSQSSAHNALVEFLPDRQQNLNDLLKDTLFEWEIKMGKHPLIEMFIRDMLNLKNVYDLDSFRRNLHPSATIVSDESLIQAFSNRTNLRQISNGLVLPVTGLDANPFTPERITQLSIGELGKAIKFNVLSSEWIGTYSVEVDNNEVQFLTATNSPATEYGNMDFYPRVLPVIKHFSELSTGPNLEAIISANTKSIPIHDLLGFIDLDPYEMILKYDRDESEYYLDQRSDMVVFLGYDGYRESNLDLMYDAIKYALFMGSTSYDLGTLPYNKVVFKS